MLENGHRRFFIPQEIKPIKATRTDFEGSVKAPFKKQSPFVSAGTAQTEYTQQNPYVRLSCEHGRSIVDFRVNANVMWGDDYGTVFGARDWKGADMSDVYGYYHFPDLRNLRIKGLLSSTWIEGMQKASLFMRSQGLPTEAYTKI